MSVTGCIILLMVCRRSTVPDCVAASGDLRLRVDTVWRGPRQPALLSACRSALRTVSNVFENF